MSLRRMIVADVALVGSVARRTIAFPCIFSRKRTSSRELATVLRLQLVEEFGPDLAADFNGACVIVYNGSRMLAGVTLDASYRAMLTCN